MKTPVSLTLTGIILLSASLVQADNFWVLGSFKNPAAADERAKVLESELKLNLSRQKVNIEGHSHVRLIIPELALDAERDTNLARLGIEPWLVTVKDSVPAAAPKMANVARQYTFLLVGEYDDIDRALALERKLAREAWPVRGAAKLVAGTVKHQIWVGPVQSSQAWQQRLAAVDLVVQRERPATAEEIAEVGRLASARTASDQSNLQSRQPASKIKKTATASSVKYPTDFNLAKLPEKRPTRP